MKPLVGKLLGRALAALGVVLVSCVCLACPPNETNLCSSSSKSDPGSCTATYDLCNGSTYVLTCTVGNSGDNCTCNQNGTNAKTFESADACEVSPDTLKKRAHDGCGWDLD